MRKDLLWLLVPVAIVVLVLYRGNDIDVDIERPEQREESKAVATVKNQSISEPRVVFRTAPHPCDGEKIPLAILYEENLRLSARDSRVELIQEFLRNQGYYRENVDGILGTATRLAIHRYQTTTDGCASGFVDEEVISSAIGWSP